MKKKAKLPKSHCFNGKRYILRWRKPSKKEWGLCDDPTADAKERFLMVDPALESKDFFETLLHEALHAEQWYLDEETVQRIAENITDLMDRCDMIKKD